MKLPGAKMAECIEVLFGLTIIVKSHNSPMVRGGGVQSQAPHGEGSGSAVVANRFVHEDMKP